METQAEKGSCAALPQPSPAYLALDLLRQFGEHEAVRMVAQLAEQIVGHVAVDVDRYPCLLYTSRCV